MRKPRVSEHRSGAGFFDDAGVRATFFVLGWVAERTRSWSATSPRRTRNRVAWVRPRLVYGLDPEQFRADLRRAKEALEDAAGNSRHRLSRPELFDHDVQLAVGAGRAPRKRVRLRLEHLPDSSRSLRHSRRTRHPFPYRVQPGRSSRCRRPRSGLVRSNLPFAGGGYFRLLPYAFTRWGMRRVNTRERAPVMFYMHPWEVDPEQPRIEVGHTTRWRHYGGLAAHGASARAAAA